jgi:inorganic pyrophosphatase
MRDDRGGDHKIIAVHVDDPQFAHFRDISELPKHTLAELERFFLDYKTLERKQVAIEALRGRADAEAVVEAAIRLYAENADRLRREVDDLNPR